MWNIISSQRKHGIFCEYILMTLRKTSKAGNTQVIQLKSWNFLKLPFMENLRSSVENHR